LSDIGVGGSTVTATNGRSYTNTTTMSWSVGAKLGLGGSSNILGSVIAEVAPSVGGSTSVSRTYTVGSAVSEKVPGGRNRRGAMFEFKDEGNTSGYSCVKTMRFDHFNACDNEWKHFYYTFWGIRDRNGRHIDQKMNYNSPRGAINFGEPWEHDTYIALSDWGY
jgi:hypothetical protein